MMIYEIMITRQADSDLRGIYEYIALELLSPENAIGQVERLEERIVELQVFPDRYRTYEREPWKSRGMRVMPVDNFLVFYIPNEKTAVVTVIRVMYNGRNVDEHLMNYPNAYELKSERKNPRK